MNSLIMDKDYLKQQSPEIVKRLISFKGVKKLILFGSVSIGQQNKDSDLDIIVIKEKVSNRYQEMIDLRKSLGGLKIPIDVLLIDENSYLNRINSIGNIYYWANKNGRVIYDSI